MSTRDHIKERKCGMLALKITDIRDFTNKLFIGEVFDKFCLSEATVTTFNTFTIDAEIAILKSYLSLSYSASASDASSVSSAKDSP